MVIKRQILQFLKNPKISSIKDYFVPRNKANRKNDFYTATTESDIQRALNSIFKKIELINKHKEMSMNGKDDIAVFIGNIKAGKSTLINCLLGNRLRVKENDAEGVITFEQIDEGRGPRIGGTAESETFTPCNFGLVPGTSWPMWDFPGFEDNRGVETEEEIAHAINIHNVLKRAHGVRFVLVVPFAVIRNDNPMPFFKELNRIRSFSKNISASLCLVSTKAERGNLKKVLEKLSDIEMLGLNADNSKILRNAQSILKDVLKNEAFFNFQSPYNFEDGSEYEMINKDTFSEALGRTAAISVTNCKVSVSDSAMLFITKILYVWFRNLVDSYTNILKEYELKVIFAPEMQGNLKKYKTKVIIKKLEDISNHSDVRNMVENLGTMCSIIDTTPVIQLIEVANYIEAWRRDNHNDKSYPKCIELFETSVKEAILGVIISLKQNLGEDADRYKKRQKQLSQKRKALEAANEKSLGTMVYEFIDQNKKDIASKLLLQAAITNVPWASLVHSAGLATGLIASADIEPSLVQKLWNSLPWK